jgi:hypothetical protein
MDLIASFFFREGSENRLTLRPPQVAHVCLDIDPRALSLPTVRQAYTVVYTRV